MTKNKEFDILIWGSSGFTGSLVAEYFVRNYFGKVNIALGGRNHTKLTAVRNKLIQINPDASNISICTSDSSDLRSMKDLVSRTRIIISTAGPFYLYGKLLVKACAEAGVHYLDITAENPFVYDVINECDPIAKKTKAVLVTCCGFDSVPSDMGTYMMCLAMKEKHGKIAKTVTMGLYDTKGGVSGGTLYSALIIMDFFSKCANPREIFSYYSLVDNKKENTGTNSDFFISHFDYDSQWWLSIFIMSFINTRIVHRSASKMPQLYAKNFQYKEGVINENTFFGGLKSHIAGFVMMFSLILLYFPFGRFLCKKFVFPTPGTGPTREQLENGFFEVKFTAKSEDNQTLMVGQVKGYEDCGYLGTAKMLSEGAMCLLDNYEDCPGNAGGHHTPASAFGSVYLRRLRKAGFTYEAADGCLP